AEPHGRIDHIGQRKQTEIVVAASIDGDVIPGKLVGSLGEVGKSTRNGTSPELTDQLAHIVAVHQKNGKERTGIRVLRLPSTARRPRCVLKPGKISGQSTAQ